MTRMYIQPSFLDSCTEHSEWAGGNDQYRGDRSVDFSTFTKGGRARVEAFSDDAMTSGKPKVKERPIANRIIPAQTTLNNIDTLEAELQKAFNNGEVHEQDYNELLYALSLRRERAHKSLLKALGKDAESDPVGQHTLDPEHVSESLKSQENSYFLSTSEGWIEKNVKDDAFFFFTGAVVCFSLLLWITN